MKRNWRLGPRYDDGGFPNWATPMVYVAVVSVFAFVLPRLERSYLASLTIDVSLSSAVTFFATVASGVMALTAMVFTIAFVMVQFSAVAYSPRLVAMFVEDPRSDFDAQDRVLALQQDKQGLGMSREPTPESAAAGPDAAGAP